MPPYFFASYLIDWSSITNGPTAMPAKNVNILDAVFGGFNVHRIGNICWVCQAISINTNMPSDSGVVLSSKIPEGWRPTIDVSIGCMGMYVNGQTNKNYGYHILTDGTIKWFCEGIGVSSELKWYSIFGVWLTDDDWPS